MVRINRNKVLSFISDSGMTQTEFLRENKIEYKSFQRAVLQGKNCSIKTVGQIAKAVGMKSIDILEGDE